MLGLGLGEIVLILVVIGFCVLLVSVLFNSDNRNTPTWHGIIISALIGCLPLYLVLCFFGLMGERKN